MAITASTDPAEPSGEAASKRDERRALGIACGAHALHDGYTDLIYIVLPIWQAEFGLPYAAVGLLRTIFSGTMASLQIPASLLAERIGGSIVLAVGTALTGLCYVLAGASAGFAWLVAALFLGGLGSTTQHPLASALVARAFAGPRSLTTLGTYNFAGDVGKVAIPAAATGLLLIMPWRPAVALLGALGLAAAAAIFLLMPRFAPEPAAASPAASVQEGGDRPAPLRTGFHLLLAIGVVDSAARAGFLVFLPFLMIGKGASVATAGLALTLTFLGGAAGKLVCAWLSARFGAIATICVTKALTAAGMLALLYLPLAAGLVLLPALGAVLNGTSSATYGSVPAFVTAAERARAFSVFYTGTLGSGALAPTLSGVVGDLIGIPSTIVAVALLGLATIPLAAWLGRHMPSAASLA